MKGILSVLSRKTQVFGAAQSQSDSPTAMDGDMSPDLDIDEIRRAASRFRMAIEACARSMLPISFEEFPRGSCGDVSPLLGTFLIELGFGPFDYVLGERGIPGYTHAWLRRGQLDVDITTDQFPDAPSPIIVCMDSQWHRTFGQRVLHVADIRIYDEQTASSLTSAYETIKEKLDTKDDVRPVG